MSDRVIRTEEEWRRLLTPEQYHVTREQGTERAFTGATWDIHERGIYRCVCCGNDLYSSEQKYESGTGWPSFWQPIKEEAVEYSDQDPLGMDRIEVGCANCGAHLGHVFEDGPAPTGLRYCLNSASLALDRT